MRVARLLIVTFPVSSNDPFEVSAATLLDGKLVDLLDAKQFY